MNKLFTLILLLITIITSANCQKIGVESGALIVHTPFFPHVNIKTVVYRQQFGIGYTHNIKNDKYIQATIFIGQDCIHSNIAGVIAGYGKQFKYINVAVIAGVYKQDKEYWESVIETEVIIRGEKCRIITGYKTYDNVLSYVPVCGIQISLKKEIGRYQFELKNNITPVIITSNISISYRIY